MSADSARRRRGAPWRRRAPRHADDASRHGATDVATLSSPTTALTAVVALGATAASVEGLAELIHATAALSAPMAWAIGSVMDLAVIVLALQAREAIVTGRGGRLEMTLTWVASVASGVASASWQLGRAGAQAAGVRLLLPLLAAGLWHLSLVGAQHAADARPARRQARASRLMLDLALAQADTSGTTRAARRERRARRALLRHEAAAAPDAQDHDLDWWRERVASVAAPPDDAATPDDTGAPPGDADATSGNEEAARAAAGAPTDDADRERAPDRPAPTATQPTTRRRIADALAADPGVTNAQLHALFAGDYSLRTIQRHRRAIETERAAGE